MSDRRQRQKEARAAKREAERKSQARKELWRRLSIAVGFGVVIVAILVVGSFTGSDESALPGTYDSFRSQDTACSGDAPPEESVMEFDGPVPQDDLTADSMAVISTSCGDITIALDVESSPETVNSFVFLARQGFYDGQVFHRIITDFVAESGDPNADGSGGPGYTIDDEYPTDPDFEYERGVVAMSNRGRGTTGSQFFIVLGEDAQALTNTFNVLGTVVDGSATLDAIASVEVTTRPNTNEQSLPSETVYINGITIETAG